MKSFYYYAASIVACLFMATSSLAQRVKPELPEPATIEEGKYYYLYNEDAGVFMDCGGEYVISSFMFETTFTFSYNSDGTYLIKRNNGLYIWSSDFNLRCNQNFIDEDCYFRLSQLEDGCYTIQRNRNYIDSIYVGYNPGESRIYTDKTENIKWRLIPADSDVEIARHILYNALESVDSKYCVAPFDEIFNTSTDKNELLAAARDVMHGNDITNKYNKHDDSYPIWFYSLQDEHGYRWGMESDNEGFNSPAINYNGQTECLKAIVNVEEDVALLSYWLDATNHNAADVYIDGAHVKNIPSYQSNDNDRYFEYLNKGVHVIEWRVYDNTTTAYDNCAIRTIKVEKIPEQISINLVEPGSLGSEILSFVDRITDAKSLKIKGRMNSDDWSTLKLITGLRSIDLSEAEITDIPNDQFYNFGELYEVILPEGLKTIGNSSIRNTRIDEIILPSTLTSLGEYAFASTTISEIVIPDGVTSIGSYAFGSCYALKKVEYPKGMKYIPTCCFEYCYHLESFEFYDGLETIGDGAFLYCYSLRGNAKIPESVKAIGYDSFRETAIDSLIVPEGVAIYDYAFRYSKLKYAELPTTYYDCSNRMLEGCSNLETIKFKSPTKVTHQYKTIIDDVYRANITLLVPDFLVSSYKLDSYWYNYGNIEGFPTTEISEWTINNPLVLDANSRFQGSPDIHLNNTSLTMNGETGMEVNEFRMNLTASDRWYDTYPYSYYSSSQVLVSADVDIKSLLELDYQTYANRWYFISLPFDIKVSDIKTDAQYAIRYYDGANRAQTGAASGNWKNYSADDIVPAGTGFAFQTSKDAWNTFVAYENVNKNRAFKAKDLSAALDENLSETSEHRGWNFVGNPWMTFYNIHSVDFTAPITVYNYDNGTYKAYSIIDDDVALHPTQAFFVQCPEDVSVITFPARGRQLTKDITNQNGGKLRGANAAKRNLVDVEIKSEDASDNTRIVVNEEAVMGYDYGSDATKFFADSDALQLYSLDSDGAAYAINERPASDGFVDLAFIAPKAGEYTLSLTRNQMGTVILTDMETGRDTDITLNDYVFSTEAGSFTDRFRLSLFPIDVTGIEGTRNDKPEVKVIEGGIDAAGHVSVFSVDGRNIAEGEGVLYLEKGTYVVRAKSESVKVVVK